MPFSMLDCVPPDKKEDAIGYLFSVYGLERVLLSGVFEFLELDEGAILDRSLMAYEDLFKKDELLADASKYKETESQQDRGDGVEVTKFAKDSKRLVKPENFQNLRDENSPDLSGEDFEYLEITYGDPMALQNDRARVLSDSGQIVELNLGHLIDSTVAIVGENKIDDKQKTEIFTALFQQREKILEINGAVENSNLSPLIKTDFTNNLSTFLANFSGKIVNLLRHTDGVNCDLVLLPVLNFINTLSDKLKNALDSKPTNTINNTMNEIFEAMEKISFKKYDDKAIYDPKKDMYDLKVQVETAFESTQVRSSALAVADALKFSAVNLAPTEDNNAPAQQHNSSVNLPAVENTVAPLSQQGNSSNPSNSSDQDRQGYRK